MGAYEDRRKKQEKKYGGTSSPETTSRATAKAVSSDESKYLARRKKQQGNISPVDNSFINTFVSDAKRYLDTAEPDYNGITFENKDSVYEARKKQANDLRSRSWKIRQYLESNKDKLDADRYNSFKSYLDDFDKASNSTMYTFYKVKERGFDESSKYASMSSNEIKAEMESKTVSEDDREIIYSLSQTLVPYDWETARKNGIDRTTFDEVEEKRKYISEKFGVDLYADIYDNVNIFNDLLSSEPIAYTTRDGKNVTWDSLYNNALMSEDLTSRLDAYSKNADWAEKSKAIRYIADTESDYSIVYSVLQSPVPYDWETAEATGVDRATFDDVEKKRKYISEKYGVDLYSDIYNNDNILSDIMSRLDKDDSQKENFENFSYLTDDERAVLSYIYTTEGRSAALDWHNSRKDLYLDRYNKSLVQGFSGVGEEHPFWGSVGSVALSLGSGVEYLADIFDYMATGETQSNSLALASSSIRSGVSETVNWEIGNWDAFDFVYNTGMSMADSAASTALLGGYGGIALGLSAAAQATNDALDRGMSQGQAFWNGLAAGVFEGLFESWSIGKFNALKEVASAHGKDIALNIAKTMLVNASEETATEVANIIYDNIINGDFSQYETLVRQYVVSGMSEEEAKRKAALELGGQIVESGASGALMGFGFGAIGSSGAIANNTIGTAVRDIDAGQTIMGADGGVDALKALAMNVSGADANSGLTKQANKVTGETFSGKGFGKVTAAVKNTANQRNVGKLYRSVSESTVSSQDQANIAKGLESNGFSPKSAKNIADALAAKLNGKQLTSFQKSTLETVEGNKKVEEVVNNLYNDAESFVGKRSADLRKFNLGISLGVGIAPGSTAKAGEEIIFPDGNSTTAEKPRAESNYETVEKGKTTLKATGETIAVKEISSLESGKVLLELENGDTVDAKDVAFGSNGDELVYEAVAVMGISVTDANEIVSAYKSGNVAGAVYAKGIKDAYNYGVFGYRLDDLAKGTYTSKLTAAQRMQAFNLGRAKAGNTKSNSPARKKSTTRKRGVVKGYGVTTKELNQSFNTTQRSAYKILDTIAEITGVDIVLYRSTSDADGNLRGGVVDGIDMSKAHGAFSWHNDKIYIDINAGVLKQAEMEDAAKYSMLRTFGHEFTHFLEKHNPVEYGNFQDLVFDVMRRNGQNPDAMIEAYMDQDSGLTRDKASREVVAEAMTDILPETNFVQELAQKHQNIFQMLLEKLKEFVTELKEHFRSLGFNRSAEAAAVKEHINGTLQYAEEIVQMFDRIAVQAVERYQTAQTAEKSTAAKSNGVQLEIKQIGDSGQFYVQADRQVLTGNDPDVWGKQIERYINDVIRQQQDITIPTSDGHILLLTGRSSYKLSDRHISMIADKVAGFLSDEEFALKGRAATHIDELIQVARFDKYKADKDEKHQNDIGEDGFNNFVAHFRDFDGKYYRIPFTAGINADEETAYSIGKIRQRSFPANRGSSPKSGRSKGGRKASGDIIYSSADQSQVKTAVQIAFENAQRKANDQKTQKQTRIPGDNGEVVDARQEVSYSLRRDAQLMDSAGVASLQRRTSTLTNRDLLAEATGTNEYERSKLKEYQEKLDNSRAQAKALVGLEKELDQLRSANDPKDRKRISFLQDEIIKTRNRISVLNGALSRMEAKDLAGVVGREKNRILERLQTEYGMIPRGENSVRADTLPKSTDGINKVSYTARTVKGAKVTPDAFAELIDTEVAKGNLTYIPITNDATTQKAVQYIQDEGWESAKGSWSANVRAGKSGAEMAAVGALLLNNAARAGDKAAWLDILHDYQILGTNTAQGLQALRILKKLQPEDSLYMIRRSIRQMVEDMHLDTEVTLDPQLEANYQNAKTDVERDAALKEITKSVADQIPSTFLDKWTALRYVNMLGNLRTQIRNITGNLGMKTVTSIKDVIATGLEQIVYLASGGKLQRTKAMIADKKLRKAAKDDFETVEAVILGGGKYSDSMEETTAFARDVQKQRTIFKFKPLEGYRKLTNWAMERGDLVFSKSAYAGALAKYLKAHGIKESDLSKVDPALMDEARLYAVKEAQEATFRDTNVLSGWISKVGRRKDTLGAAKVMSEGIMPFRKTPANVLVRAEEYSPLGVINSVYISIQKMRKGSDVTGAQVINSWAKTLTGTALFGLGMLLQNLGLLTGAGDDDEDKDQFESLNGWQNYAIVLPDGTNLTIDFLSPAAMPMFMGAQMMSLMHDGGIEAKEIESALLSIADPMVQMSMLQGVNDTLENIQYAEDNLGQFLINACTSYLTQGLTNTLLGQMERSFESVRNSTYVDQDNALPNWLQRQLGKTSAKILGWDFNQIPYINAWGEEEQNAGILANMAYNLLSPSYVDKGAEDAVSVELARLNDIQSDVNVFPRTPDKTISYEDKNGVVHDDYNLSAEEYVALAKEQGQTQRKILEKMLSSDLYGSLPDQYKAKAIAFAYDYAREGAQIEVLGRSSFSAQWMSEIKDDIAEGIVSHVIEENIKGMYLDGDISADEAVAWRVKYCGDTQAEATEKVAYWKFQIDNPVYTDWSESTVTKFKDLDVETAARVVEVLDGLTPENGRADVRTIQKVEAIAMDRTLSTSDKKTALHAIMDDKLATKFDSALNMGIGLDDFAQAYRKYLDTEGKGKKATVISYYRNAFGINETKAEALYDLFAGKK